MPSFFIRDSMPHSVPLHPETSRRTFLRKGAAAAEALPALASTLSACGKTKAATTSVAGPDSTAAAKQRAILRGLGPTNSATVTRAGEITPP